jgi:hypothetical protein
MGGIRPILALIAVLMVAVLHTMAYTPTLDEQAPTRRQLTTSKTKKSQPKAKPSVSKKNNEKDDKKQSKSSPKKASPPPSASKPKKKRKKNKTRQASCNSRDILKLTWTLNMKTQFGTDTYTVPCGTTIVFDWTGEVHGVAQIPSLKCPKDPKDYKIVPGGRERIGAKASYKTTEVGKKLYFACQIYGHCQTGQLVQINVIPSKKEEKKKEKKKKKNKQPSNRPPPLPCSDAVCFCSTPVRKYGFQASPFDCQAFYQCSQSYGWLVRCPLGALYNAVNRQCDLDFKVDCSVGGWYGAARPR